MPHALVVDDEEDSAEMMAALIAAEGYTVATAGTLQQARRKMSLQMPDVVLLDLLLPDGNGLDLVEQAKAEPNVEVVLITGHASVETSVQALRMGAADYLTKPLSIKQLQGVLSRLRRPSTLSADAAGMQRLLAEEGHFGQLWGRSAPMRRVHEQILRVSGTGVTVFITGESGTGKEVVARTVHDLSRRRAKPFLGVNCGAISPNLIESEIFGHEKGSFTGAERQHQGFFERANGGTLFLDEITEMPLDLQVKLLRVLETGRFQRLGSNFEQASMDLGAGPFTTFRLITLPMLRSALLAGALLSFGLSFDEIVVTTFTASSQDETLPIWIFQNLFRPNQAPVVNVVAAALILLSIIPIYFAQKLAGTDESVAAAR